MTTLKARYDGRVFVPQEPVDLPAGLVVDIPLPESPPSPPSRKPLAELAEVLKQFPADPDWPPDGAMQHDHYLYGTPKKANP